MPFKSKRQQRAAFGGHIPGFSKEKAKEWAKETPDMKGLPERAPAEKGKPTLRSKKAELSHAHESGKGLSEAAIARGVKVELEHTKDPGVARQIAIDHLRERPDYYERLADAEKSPMPKKASLQKRSQAHTSYFVEMNLAKLAAGESVAPVLGEKRRSAGVGDNIPPQTDFAQAVEGDPVKAAGEVIDKIEDALDPVVTGLQKATPAQFALMGGLGGTGYSLVRPPGWLLRGEGAVAGGIGGAIGAGGAKYVLDKLGVTERALKNLEQRRKERHKRMRQEKSAADDRVSRISDRIDDAGIGLLAAPYAASAVGHGLAKSKNPKLRAAGAALERGLGTESRFGKSHGRELAGLAMVAPGVTHTMAKGINKVLPQEKSAADQTVLSDHNDPPGYMMVQNLNRLTDQSKQLAKAVSVKDNAEPWVESKIDRASEAIDAVHDYMKYKAKHHEPDPKHASVDLFLKMAKDTASGTLSAADRDKIKHKNFAIPKGEKYPIHDEEHARNALARVAQFGSMKEQAQVRAAVAKKFPGIDLTEASKPEKRSSLAASMGLRAVNAQIQRERERALELEDYYRKHASIAKIAQQLYPDWEYLTNDEQNKIANVLGQVATRVGRRLGGAVKAETSAVRAITPPKPPPLAPAPIPASRPLAPGSAPGRVVPPPVPIGSARTIAAPRPVAGPPAASPQVAPPAQAPRMGARPVPQQGRPSATPLNAQDQAYAAISPEQMRARIRASAEQRASARIRGGGAQEQAYAAVSPEQMRARILRSGAADKTMVLSGPPPIPAAARRAAKGPSPELLANHPPLHLDSLGGGASPIVPASASRGAAGRPRLGAGTAAPATPAPAQVQAAAAPAAAEQTVVAGRPRLGTGTAAPAPSATPVGPAATPISGAGAQAPVRPPGSLPTGRSFGGGDFTPMSAEQLAEQARLADEAALAASPTRRALRATGDAVRSVGRNVILPTVGVAGAGLGVGALAAGYGLKSLAEGGHEQPIAGPAYMGPGRAF